MPAGDPPLDPEFYDCPKCVAGKHYECQARYGAITWCPCGECPWLFDLEEMTGGNLL